MRIKVVSNTTMEPLARYLGEHEISLVGPGGFPAQLMGDAVATDFNSEVVVIHVDGDALLSDSSVSDADAVVLDAIAQLAVAQPQTLLILNTLLPQSGSGISGVDQSPDGPLHRAIAWNLAVMDLSNSQENVAVVDLLRILDSLSLNQVFSDRFWYLGRIRYSQAAFSAIAEQYRMLLDAYRGARKKVLVVDLDNTLWGGVLGEDGASGVALSEDGLGKCFRDLQADLKQLERTGVLLAVCSKNDDDSAMSMLNEHPMMVLRSTDFAALRINWVDKAINVEEIAEELDLGLDSFVFLDDNPRERERIRQALPEVLVLEFPDDPADLSRWFRTQVSPRYFNTLSVSGSDAGKTEQYRAKTERSRLLKADPSEFIASLQIELIFTVDDTYMAGRIAQMTQKTNQFNLTTRRETLTSVRGLLDSERHRVITCHYRDRFGDEGVIAAVFLDLATGKIMNLLVSCRVLGKGVEQALLSAALKELKEAGHTLARARYIPTARNSVCATFLMENGFEPLVGDEEGTFLGERLIS